MEEEDGQTGKPKKDKGRNGDDRVHRIAVEHADKRLGSLGEVRSLGDVPDAVRLLRIQAAFKIIYEVLYDDLHFRKWQAENVCGLEVEYENNYDSGYDIFCLERYLKAESDSIAQRAIGEGGR